MENIVAEKLAERMSLNEAVPPSLTVRHSTLHSRLVVEANEQGVSLNQWVAAKLAERPAGFSVD